jgi:hypothetical protein
MSEKNLEEEKKTGNSTAFKPQLPQVKLGMSNSTY